MSLVQDDFGLFLEKVVEKIKYGQVDIEDFVSKESFLLFTFIIENVFNVVMKWTDDLEIKRKEANVTDIDLDHVKSIKTCDLFMTFFPTYKQSDDDLVYEVALLLKIFLDARESNLIYINYKWIATAILLDFPCINTAIKSLRQKFRFIEEYKEVKEILINIPRLHNLAGSLRSSRRRPDEYSWINTDENYLLEALKNGEWTLEEKLALEKIATMFKIRNILGRKKYNNISGGGKASKKRKASDPENKQLVLTEKEFEIVETCKTLLSSNQDKYKWLIDVENIKTKKFLDTKNTKDPNTLEFLVELNFETMPTLKKNQKRVKSYISKMNEFFSREDIQELLKRDKNEDPAAKKIKQDNGAVELNKTDVDKKRLQEDICSEVVQDSKRSRKDISQEKYQKISKGEQHKVDKRNRNRQYKLVNPENYKKSINKRKLEMAEARLDPGQKKEDNLRRTKERQSKIVSNLTPKLDEHEKKLERNRREKERIRKNRCNATYEFNARLVEKLSKHKKGSAEAKFLNVMKMMQKTPSEVCSCCQRLNFEHKMVGVKIDTAYQNVKKSMEAVSDNQLEYSRKKFFEDCIAIKSGKMKFCQTCATDFYRGKIPTFAPINSFKLDPIPPAVAALSDLEETLIKPVIGFMQVKDLKPYSRFTEIGAKGATINIHIDVKDTLNVLPRKFNDASVIQIKLKRHLAFKKAYMFETISLKRLYEALDEMKDCDVYKNIDIKNDIFNGMELNDDGTVNFVVDPENNDTAEEDDKITEDDLKQLKEAEELAQKMNEEYGQEGADFDALIFNMPVGVNEDNYMKLLNVKLEDLEEDQNNDEDKNKDNKSDSNKNNDNNEELKLIEIAPGANKKPQLARSISHYDEKANPKAYGGKFLNYNEKLISMIKRYKLQISIKDRRFASPAMILFKAKRKLEHQLASCIYTALRKGKKGKITVRDVLDPERLQKLCDDDEAYRFMQSITIAPGYLEKSKKKALAFIRQLGQPTFFLTLSPKEHNWPELLKLLWELKHPNETITFQEVNCLSDIEKNELIRSDPVTVTQFYSNRIDQVMKYMQTEANKIFGDSWVVDYIRRREYQMRGAPHEHCILYCKDVIHYDEKMSAELRKKMIEFIDRVITCENDPSNPNVEHQYHVCTFTCWKKNKLNNKNCRFKYPRFPMKETEILKPLKAHQHPPEVIKKAEQDLVRIKEQLESYNILLKNHFMKQKKGYGDDEKLVDAENNSKEETDLYAKAKKDHEKFLNDFDDFDAMLKRLNLTNSEYILALRTSIHADTIFHKRKPNAININNYNTNLLNLWQANVDLQFVLDPYACVAYLFSYILKTDKGIIRLMAEAIKESKEAGEHQQEYLRKIANAFNNSLVIGASQAADYLMGTPLTRFSRDVVFINTNRPQNRIGIKKSAKKLRDMNLDDTDIFELGLIDKYESRPARLKDVCLADFASKHREDKSYKPDDFQEKEYKEGKARIIRCVGYKKEKNEIDYYREQLMLYLPWTIEKEELLDLELKDLKEKYEANKKSIDEKYFEYHKIEVDDLEKLKKQYIDEDEDDEDNFGGFFQHRRDNDSSDDENERYDAFPNEGKKKREKKENKSDDAPAYNLKLPPRVPDEEINKILMSLNNDQRRIVYTIYDAFQNGIKDLKVFMTGTAGTGKSFVIRAIYQIMTNFFDRNCDNPDDKEADKVVLAAPTGVASFLIGGYTIHHTFRLPINNRNITLSESVANTIYSKLRHVEIIIIDEISFMSNVDFSIIDQRCRQIFNVDKPFGGKCVILVGDLCQLPPVKGRPIYTSFVEMRGRHATMADLSKDYDLWRSFKIYVLQQIMRQKNIKYIEALTGIVHRNLSNESFEYLMKRYVTEDKIPTTAIRLYWTNKQVDEYNANVLAKTPGVEYISIAEDEAIITNTKDKGREQEILDEFILDDKNSINIPYKISFKKGLKYMLTQNVDVGDGLVNGAFGVLEDIELDSNKKPKVIYLRFINREVGKKLQRHNGCVPLKMEKIEIVKQDPKTQKEIRPFRIVRKQFSVRMCEAITINKSQGQTFNEAAVCATGICNRVALLFTGFSRTDYEGLYIFGEFKRPITKMSKLPKIASTRQEEDDDETENERDLPQIEELKRMKAEASLSLPFDTLEASEENSATIIYQNINGYQNKAQFIIADLWYQNADVLIFSEANANVVTSYPKSYEVMFPRPEDKYVAKRNSGLVILAKPNTIQNLSGYKIKKFTNGHIDLRTFMVRNHFVIIGYKSPQVGAKEFIKELNSHIAEAPNELYITLIGDFNFEAGKRAEEFQNKIVKHIKFPETYKRSKELHNQLSPHHITTVRGTQIDVVFTNSQEGSAGSYPSPNISDHRAVYYRTKGKRITHYLEKVDSKIEKKHKTEENQVTTRRTRKQFKNESDVKIKNVNLKPVDNIQQNNVIFDNTIEIDRHHYRNLCCFNAGAHGFIAACKNDENFVNYLRSQTDSIYFKTMLEFINNPCNRKWINLILEKNRNILSNQENETSMFYNVVDSLLNFLKDQFASVVKRKDCISCENLLKEDEFHIIHLAPNICNFHSKNDIESTIKRVSESFDTLREVCNTCGCINSDPKCIPTYKELLVIDCDYGALTHSLNKLAKTITLDGKSYELKIVLNETTAHYNAYVKVQNGFLYIDDFKGGNKFEELLTEDELRNNKNKDMHYEKLKVKVLIYFQKCHNVADARIKIEPSDNSNNIAIKEKSQLTPEAQFRGNILFPSPMKPKIDEIEEESSDAEEAPIKLIDFILKDSYGNVRFEMCENMLPPESSQVEYICEFINLSCINANAHGFVKAMLNDQTFREFVDNEIRRNNKLKYTKGHNWMRRMLTINATTLFSQLFDMIFNENEKTRNSSWAHFISDYVDNRVQPIYSGHNIKYDFKTDIHHFYTHKRGLLGTFSSCDFKNICSVCNIIEKVLPKNNSCIFIAFKNGIFSNLPQEIVNSVSNGAVCKNSICKSKLVINPYFNRLVLVAITIDKNNFKDNHSVNLSEIPLEIILPSENGRKKLYWLQFIQILKDINKQSYSVISNMNVNFEERDSDEPDKIITSNNCVTPNFVSYFEQTNKMLLKPIFLNVMDISIKTSLNESKVFKVFNMCCWNSLINPIQRLMRTNKSCREYFEANQGVKFFKLMIEIFYEQNEKDRNTMWVQFIYDNSSTFANKIVSNGDMTASPDDVLEAVFKKDYAYCSIEIVCSKCKHVSCPPFNPGALLLLNVSATTMRNLSAELLRNVQQINCKKTECQKCKNKDKNKQNFHFNKFIFIYVSRLRTPGTNITNFNVDQNELSFVDIPKVLDLNGKYYNLASFHNFKHSYNHYTALINVQSLDSHLEIDDLQSSHLAVQSNKEFVNPKLMIYMCNNN